MKIRTWDARRSRGLTLVQLSGETGISKTTLNNIENEKVTPRIDQLEKIAKALDCKIGDLVESPYM